MINKSAQVSDKTIKAYYAALEDIRAGSIVTHNQVSVNYFDCVVQRIKRYFQRIARRG